MVMIKIDKIKKIKQMLDDCKYECLYCGNEIKNKEVGFYIFYPQITFVFRVCKKCKRKEKNECKRIDY